MPEGEIDPRRLMWVAPLTILASIAAVLVVRRVAIRMIDVPATFDPLHVGPPIFDTAVLVGAGIIVFAFVAANAARPARAYWRVSFIALLVSFVPDLMLPGRFPNATWTLAGVLMVMHVVAWLTTATLLTTLTMTAGGAGDERRPELR